MQSSKSAPKYGILSLLLTILIMGLGLFVLQQQVFACGCSQGGSTSCGGPGSCWKSSPESSCPGGKWWCECSCENLGSGYVCHSCGGSNPPDTCNETNPGAVNLKSPANNSILDSNTTVLEYKNSGGWGEGCPTKKTNKIQIKTANAEGTCTGGSWTNTTATQSNLDWDTTYCWRVVRSNGARSKTSAVWRFTTPATPEITSSGFVANTINKCDSGSAVSGRLTGTENDSNINNPVKYTIDFTYSGGVDDLDSVQIAFVADNTYVKNKTPNSSPAQRFIEEVEEVTHDPGNLSSFMLKITNLNTTPVFSSIDSDVAPFYGSGKTSGDLTVASGIASLLDVGGDTDLVQLDANSYRATFTIEFKPTYAYEPLGVYVAALAKSANGTLVSQSPQNDRSGYNGNLVMDRANDWLVDMQAPAINISSANFLGNNRFQLTWDIQDQGAVEDVRSYCYFEGDSLATITDETVGANIVLNAAEKGYPEPDYCLVTTAGTNARTYSVISGALDSDINLSAYAKDNACNITQAANTVDIPLPWMMTLFNTTSVGGFDGIEIPDTAINLPSLGLSLSGNDFFSTYVAISGSNTLVQPTPKQSMSNTYTTSYNNTATTPANFGFDSWYELILALANDDSSIVQSNLSSVSGNLSNAYGLQSSTRVTVLHEGDLQVDSGTICDITGVILVEGDVLIEPDLTKTTENGCIFVAKGNIKIGKGTYKSSTSSVGGISKYDVVQAMLVADGKLTVVADPSPTGQVPDGLYIQGLVYAGQVNFGRSLTPNQSANQPSELIDYDPSYIYNFRELLSAAEFSLREY